MVNILPAAPHGTTDQMSPDHAAVPTVIAAAGVAIWQWGSGLGPGWTVVVSVLIGFAAGIAVVRAQGAKKVVAVVGLAALVVVLVASLPDEDAGETAAAQGTTSSTSRPTTTTTTNTTSTTTTTTTVPPTTTTAAAGTPTASTAPAAPSSGTPLGECHGGLPPSNQRGGWGCYTGYSVGSYANFSHTVTTSTRDYYAESWVEFNLAGRFSRFDAIAGISNESDPGMRAHFKVTGDGRVIWEGELQRAQPVELKDQDVSGVILLRLSFDPIDTPGGEDLRAVFGNPTVR